MSDLASQKATLSFRDPAGNVLRYGDRVLRMVNSLGAADLRAFLESPTGKRLMTNGRVVGTRALDAAESRDRKSVV